MARTRALRNPERYAGSPTDATGRFELRDLPAGTFDLLVRAHGYGPLTVPSLAVQEGKGMTDLGTVVLAPGAAVHGLVVDPRGEPIAGAEVRAAAAQQDAVQVMRPHESGPVDALSAADGSFVLDDRSPGESLHLTVTHASYGTVSLPGVAVPAEAPVRVVLQPAGRVAGRAVDADGKPVAGASVLLDEEQSVNLGGETAIIGTGRVHRGTTDDEGTFAFEGIPPGPFRLAAQAPHFQTAELTNLELQGGQDLARLEIVLQAGATIEEQRSSASAKLSPAEIAVRKVPANHANDLLVSSPSVCRAASSVRPAPMRSASWRRNIVTSRGRGDFPPPTPALRARTPGVTTSASIGSCPRYWMRRTTSSREGASTSPTTISPAGVTAR